ncbi:eukaryotic rRNA processing, partial [Gilbertella persicaria]|uniref:eukaryotic rRNA processing n=1 Tax=Gilbertella persicaria TaxID=101096 RepID=UPI00221EF7E7
FKLKNLPWIETMTITSTKPIELEDPQNDMQRELAFYQQALEAAKLGRDLVKKANVEFSRPDDYFAEMLKSDEHMAKIRQKLLDESAAIKASEEAKHQRQLKKFGKKVQVEKQLERQKQKTDMLEKIKLLKRSKL